MTQTANAVRTETKCYSFVGTPLKNELLYQYIEPKIC